ncbi:MAG: hypothetical protein LBQ84_07545 [Flavobacteriaceae bacterium]|nr:hypothetical protein [Flavobacteriaceae bacterium]
MKKILLLSVVLILSINLYGQRIVPGGKYLAKVYLKNGEIKEGKASINDNRTRVAGIGIKGKKYLKEISLKPNKGKKEKISAEDIDKIEFTLNKIFNGQTTVIYKPVLIDEDKILVREIVSGKLYGVEKVRGFSNGEMGDSQHEVYYINKGGTYKKTSLSEIKKEYKCNMDEDGKREEKIKKCLGG